MGKWLWDALGKEDGKKKFLVASQLVTMFVSVSGSLGVLSNLVSGNGQLL